MRSFGGRNGTMGISYLVIQIKEYFNLYPTLYKIILIDYNYK